jgi:CheY-like chemotaxis protein
MAQEPGATQGMPYTLIVEDEQDMLDILQLYLQTLGLKTQIARNGQEALEIIRKQPPAAIIADLMMPVKSGVSMLLEMERDNPDRKIPVIIYSAIGSYAEITNHLPGVIGILPKGEGSLSDLKVLLIKANVLKDDSGPKTVI